MDISFTQGELAFQREVREWIAASMPRDMKRKADAGAHFEPEEVAVWHRILAEKGWVAPHWPVEHGGTGWEVTRRFIFTEELARANTPELSPFGLFMVGPLLIQFGSEAQKRRFLPGILAGDVVWCQGYSEPNAGSDLASLQLRAEKSGSDYVLNGQKTWTTNAQYADWIFVLARTSSNGKKQEGITFLLADIKRTEGITVKPFLTTGGTYAFAETWFVDARVPQENRVGPENGGWAMAKALLGHERTLLGGVSQSMRWLHHAKQIARGTPVGQGTLLDDPAFRRRIARLEMRQRALAMVQNRTLAAAQLGRAPGSESSIIKLVGTELLQETTELCMDALGHDVLGWLDSPAEALPEQARYVASQFNYLRASTIYGGSNEIQRNIIAKAILGLPQGRVA